MPHAPAWHSLALAGARFWIEVYTIGTKAQSVTADIVSMVDEQTINSYLTFSSIAL